ncbi:uncharacterized protein LOC134848061 [Symsagittifera roscoffensis]|uniref:uncharacterized protein LOC134848061 n=1 Tax=Symsagittifera roscoffensis TaxID=84072 RepID=UPI00307CB4DE
MVSMRQKIKSSFYFEPKMGLYPFDCQSLPIEVSSSREIDEIELDEDEYECCSINISSSTSRNHNHQSSDFSIQTLVSTSREISLDCLDESSHHVFTCTAYACRTWISHMLFTLLPIFLLAFAVVLIGGILPHSQSSSAPQEISDDSSSSSSSSSPVSSYNHEISSELTRVANPIILLIVSCFFVLLSIKTGSFEATRNTGSNTLLGVYIVSHCIFVLLLAIKYISEMGGVSTNGRQQQQLLFFPPLEVQLGGGRVLGLGQIAALILFLAINFVFYISVVILLIWRCIGMKRKARRLMKRQTDYRRLRSAREHSVQSFSNISRNKLHSKNRHRTTAAQVRPRPFSAAVVTSEHAGAMPRSKWRLEQSNNPSENNSSSGDLFDHAPSPDSHMPRSISFPTSVIHGFKEIPV